jgi:hypothetical protein
VIRRLDTKGQPVPGTETTASGAATVCDHRQAQPGMSVGQGVRVWSGLCAGGGDAPSGNRITIPDRPPDPE